jgi:outer membrane cobalamin receptor
LYFSEEEPCPVRDQESVALSRVAENMTVATAADIKLANAHTLADVLNTVRWRAIYRRAGFFSKYRDPGAPATHVTVVLDGWLSMIFGERWRKSAISRCRISRRRDRKGPASSAWVALGGVVNVITKTCRVVDRGRCQAHTGALNSAIFALKRAASRTGSAIT